MIGSSRAMQRAAAADRTSCGDRRNRAHLRRKRHRQGTRRSNDSRAKPARGGPLVSLNCPALSAQLTESELFGHKRGAFTGADADRTGRFELAHGGSILLDEVTEIDLKLQAKLLRVLQERSFERVGSSETVSVDVRVIATTNRDLPAEIAAGRFREDLYYRLAVVPIVVPPLRERAGDVLELADHFLAHAAERLDRGPFVIEPAARELLAAYDWPGNVRELQNIITRACVLNQGEPIRADELRPWLRRRTRSRTRAQCRASDDALPLGMTLDEMERRMIVATLERSTATGQKRPRRSASACER